MINEPVGIATTATTWYWLAGITVLWAMTFPLLVRGWKQFSDIGMSLLGLAWVAFGFGIVGRFLLLTVDAEVFASPSLHLAELPSEAVDFALLTAGLFWLTFTIGAVIVLALPPPRALTLLLRQADRFSPDAALPAIAFCSGCVLAVLLLPLPAALITPMSVLGSMWVIPATLVWSSHFTERRRPAWVLAVVFMPAIIRLVLSPYREQLLVMVLVVLASAIHARRRLNPFVMAPLVVAFALVSTMLVGTYRQVLSWNEISDSATGQSLRDRPFADFVFSGNSVWLENLQRFHVFDSLLLTVDLVPDVFPYAERRPLLEGVTRGLVPRFLNPAKDQSNQALRFQTSIWAHYNDPTLDYEDATAAIAPSMPGSLYEAGGLRDTAIGGFLWAALIAVITRVIADHRTPAAVGLYVLCAVQALAGLERDYAMAVSTLLQTLVVFFMLCALHLLSERRGTVLLKTRPLAP